HWQAGGREAAVVFRNRHGMRIAAQGDEFRGINGLRDERLRVIFLRMRGQRGKREETKQNYEQEADTINFHDRLTPWHGIDRISQRYVLRWMAQSSKILDSFAINHNPAGRL
ncbi:MAG: hypothetical protein WBE09_09455, partial [Candidatus Acidiferrales bacterium]